MLDFYCHPTCSTCKKAKKWLDQYQIPYRTLNLLEEAPPQEMLAAFMQTSGLPVKRFFNTSGNRYRELELKDRLSDMNIEEAAALLSTEGMLVKRPFLTDGSKLTLGFKESEYEENWKNAKENEKSANAT